MCTHMYLMKKYCFYFRKPLHTKIEKEKKKGNIEHPQNPLHQVFMLQQEQKLLITNRENTCGAWQLYQSGLQLNRVGDRLYEDHGGGPINCLQKN